MISLRDLRTDDRDRLFRWRNLPEVRRWMFASHEITREEHDRWFASIRDDPAKRYWVIEVDATPVGVVNLIGLGSQQCSFGLYIGDDAARGSGAARAAVRHALEYAFKHGESLVVAEALSDNVAAVALYQAIGMTDMGETVAPDRRSTIRFEMTYHRWDQPTPQRLEQNHEP